MNPILSKPQSHASKVALRWSGPLSAQFCPVSSYFLANYHRLASQPGERGLNSTEAMLIIQLMDFKWDERLPFPSLGTIADRMAITRRHVRDTLKSLEGRGYVKRIANTNGGTNKYDFAGLIGKLETLMQAEADSNESKEAA
jgi:hypothetical protein